jgi:hypothetical protein
MKSPVPALLLKEWIKLRRGIWIIPLLLLYAAGDSFLALKTIHRVRGGFGLFSTLVNKQPQFFGSYWVLFIAGVLLAFLQFWPETQGKRLRLLFHTPIQPERIIGTTLGCGLAIMLLTNVAGHLLLAGGMLYFHLPKDIIVPVLQTLAAWSILSLACYLGTAAFLCNANPVIRAFVIAAVYAMHTLMGEIRGYGLNVPSFPPYLIATAALIPLVYFTCLRFMSAPESRWSYRIARSVSLLLVVASLCSVLPTFYWRTVMPKLVHQKMYYSSVWNQFVVLKHYPDAPVGPGAVPRNTIELEDGTPLNQRQLSFALPTLFGKNLLKWNALPATINGIRITQQQVVSEWQFLSFKPWGWNAPAPLLHMLFESNPVGAKLENPSDFFRLTAAGDGLEFIDPTSGRIDSAKSRRFSEALQAAGFAWPVTSLAGNPDVRKEYDEGYLLIDANNRMFQLKMVDGAPVCIDSGQTVPGRVRGMEVAEHQRREMLGYVATDDAFYVVMQKDLSLEKIPVESFSADRTDFSLWADLFGKSVIAEDVTDFRKGALGEAMTAGFEVHREFRLPREQEDIAAMDLREKAASFLFPTLFTQRERTSPYLRLRMETAEYPLIAAIGNLLMVTVLFLAWRRKKQRFRPWDALLVACFGPVALCAVLLEGCRKPLWMRWP